MKFRVTVVIFVWIKLCQTQTNYCSPSLCPSGDPHIACNGLQRLGPQCGTFSVEVAMDLIKQTLIVDLHNQLRSTVAMGRQTYPRGFYPTAARMATMQWDTELASIAANNARSCVYAHDKCRSTVAFPYAGQNIGMYSYYGYTFTDVQFIQGVIFDWYSEFADCNPTYTASYPFGYTGPQFSHFTKIVSDRSTRIGCAMVRFFSWPWTNQYLVCNYALTNIIAEPTYVPGPSCSRCTTGCNPRYPGLCNVNENIVPKPSFLINK